MNEDELKKHEEEMKRQEEEMKKQEKIMNLKTEEIAKKIEDAMKIVEEKVQKAMENIDIDIDIDVPGEPKPGDSKTLKNLGVMNLKDIDGEGIENMKEIKNLGVIIVPEKYISKISEKVVKNLGIIVPFTEGMRFYSGSTEIDSNMLEALDEPIRILNTGSLSFKENIDGNLIKTKIEEIKNYGHISAPEAVHGFVMSKVTENSGQISKNGGDD